MIVQNVSQDGARDDHVHAAEDRPADRRADPRRARRPSSARSRIERDPDIAKVSLIGAGHEEPSRASPPTCSTRSPTPGINIEIISTSSIRVSCVIRAAQVERAVQAVHERFQGFAQARVDG